MKSINIINNSKLSLSITPYSKENLYTFLFQQNDAGSILLDLDRESLKELIQTDCITGDNFSLYFNKVDENNFLIEFNSQEDIFWKSKNIKLKKIKSIKKSLLQLLDTALKN